MENKPENNATRVSEQGLTPERFTGIKTTPPATKAAGTTGVFNAIANAAKYMNIPDAVKLSLKMNQKGGFDCPGCAWPDPQDKRSAIAEYCENGLKALAEEAQKKTIGREFFARHKVSELLKLTDFELGKSGRLTEPMAIKEGEEYYSPISWEEVFNLLGKHLRELDPNQAIFYTSGRTANETAFMYQLFVREYGTNNLPDCSNMCHESSGVALSKTLGIGKGSTTLNDLHKAELVIVIGQNPGTNHPRMLLALEKCKRNGGKIITVNPIKEAGLLRFVNPQNLIDILKKGTQLTDLYIQIAIGRDMAFLKCLIKILWEREKQHPSTVFDTVFIKEKTANYEAFIAQIDAEDLQNLITASEVEEAKIYEAAELIMASQKIVICWAMGVTQHKNSVGLIQEIVNLLLIKGSIGKEGAGTFPVRGHSNVQGDRTMGVWEKPKADFLKKLDEVFGIQSPREDGYDVVAAIKAMEKGNAKLFLAMGGNFLSATPDTALTAKALKQCSVTAHISTKLNRSHLIHGKIGLILPCKGRTDKDIQDGVEQFVTVENSEGFVSASQGSLRPCSPHLKSEPEIVSGIARATLGDKSPIPWGKMAKDYALVRDYIAKVIPGFENFNEKISPKKGFYLPNGARQREFNNVEKKALFTVNLLTRIDLKDNDLLLTTIRSHDQYNTTIYGLDDRYRGVFNERRVVFINPKDAQKLGFQEQEVVDIVSNYNGQERRADFFKIVYYDITPKCIAAYFPEANAVVPISEIAYESHTPTYKSVRVQLQKSERL